MCEVEKWDKKIAKFFLAIMKKLGTYIDNMFSPTFVPNLVTLAWKMSSGMPKEAGSLNGPLCAYLMKQNLHDRSRPRSWGNKCPCQVWKWSVKNNGRESVNGACLPCHPPARQLGRRQYPGALKGCGLKTCLWNFEQISRSLWKTSLELHS